MFYLNSTINFGISPELVFQLEVYYKVDRYLTSLTAQQNGTTSRWYSNKTSLVSIVQSNNQTSKFYSILSTIVHLNDDYKRSYSLLIFHFYSIQLLCDWNNCWLWNVCPSLPNNRRIVTNREEDIHLNDDQFSICYRRGSNVCYRLVDKELQAKWLTRLFVKKCCKKTMLGQETSINQYYFEIICINNQYQDMEIGIFIPTKFIYKINQHFPSKNPVPYFDCRIMHLAGYLPLLALFPLWFLIPESPRWLLAKGRVEDVKKEIRYGARWMKIHLNSNILQEDCVDGLEESTNLNNSSRIGKPSKKQFQ